VCPMRAIFGTSYVIRHPVSFLLALCLLLPFWLMVGAVALVYVAVRALYRLGCLAHRELVVRRIARANLRDADNGWTLPAAPVRTLAWLRGDYPSDKR
jgi:hypothetical protein